MPTIIKGRFDKPVAEKIYSNSIKGNPAFKPWKGKNGCAWFGYDGNPNPGALARNKPVLVEATVDIPHNASVIQKATLESKLEDFLVETKQHFASAEGKLWDWAGAQGEKAATGFLIVEVGLTKLSPLSDGKYLLVNNHGMGSVQLSVQQQEALLAQLDKGTLEKLTLKQQQQENIHGKVIKLVVDVPTGKEGKYDEKDVISHLDSWIRGRVYKTDPIIKSEISFEKVKLVWVVTHRFTCVVEFGSYVQAKRNARAFSGASAPLPLTDKSTVFVKVNSIFGQQGSAYVYKNTNNVVSPPVLGECAW